MPQPTRILYVDDYPLDRELVRDALAEAAGFHVTEAGSRAAFEQRLAEGDYDLVLSDFNIAGFEGLDVLDAVHAKDPDVPVVIVTGTGSEEIAVETMKRGAADYVIKSPDHIRRLPVTIRAVLEKQQLQEERTQAIEALRRSEERYRTLVETMGEGLATLNQDGQLTYANDRFCEMLGYTRDELIGKHHLCVIADEYHDLHAAMLRRRRAGASGSYESALKRKDGATVPVLLAGRPIVDDDGNFAGTLGVFTDITERKEAEAEIHRLSQFQASIIDDASLWLDVLDEEGNVVVWNRAAEEISGYSRGEVVGHDKVWQWLYPDEADVGHDKVWQWLYPDEADHDEVREYVNTVLETGEPVEGFETTIHCKDGQTKIMSWNSRRLLDETGAPMGPVVLGTDITERKRAEEEIKQRNRELATLLDVSRQLASRHDLDQLLETIMGAVVDTLPAAEASSLWLHDEERGKLVARAWAGHDDEAMSGLAVDPDTSLVGLVYQTREPHLIEDLAEEPAFERLERPAIDAVRSVVGVPLMGEDQILGALFADSYSHTGVFDDNDQRLLQSLAGHAAIAIEDARLFEQVQAGRQRLQDLSERLVEAQEIERRHIARELHDEIGQTLTGLNLVLEMNKPLTGDVPPEVLTEAQTLANQVQHQVRQLSLDLRPSMLDDLGLLPALIWQFGRYTDQTRIDVDFKHRGLADRRFPKTIETTAYRIVQEALTNVARHAGVDEVVVRAWADEQTLNLQVEDEGAGFDVDAVLDAGDTVGVASMRERVTLVGGELIIDSTPGAGTSIVAALPVEGFIERRGSRR